MERFQKHIALRIVLPYCTISRNALMVFGSIPPIDLMVTECIDLHKGRINNSNMMEVKKVTNRGFVER